MFNVFCISVHRLAAYMSYIIEDAIDDASGMGMPALTAQQRLHHPNRIWTYTPQRLAANALYEEPWKFISTVFAQNAFKRFRKSYYKKT